MRISLRNPTDADWMSAFPSKDGQPQDEPRAGETPADTDVVKAFVEEDHPRDGQGQFTTKQLTTQNKFDIGEPNEQQTQSHSSHNFAAQKARISLSDLADTVRETYPAARGESRPVQIRRETGALVKFAIDNRLLLQPQDLSGLKKSNIQSSEHSVFLDEKSNLVVKVTNPGEFGFVMGDDERLTPATPSEYFTRMDLMNDVFGDSIKLAGVIMQEGKPSVVITQPFMVAASNKSKYPSHDQVDEYMERRGFERMLNMHQSWQRKSDGVRCHDCRVDNFILTKEGVEPVDLILQHADAISKSDAEVVKAFVEEQHPRDNRGRFATKGEASDAASKDSPAVTKSPSFKNWFGKSVVTENGKPSGAPKVLFHGSTHDFTAFDPFLGNAENHFGKGIYLTDSKQDVDTNYAGEGPDLTSRIEREAERIAQERNEEYPRSGTKELERLKAEAKEKLGVQSQGAVYPVYAKMENPVVITPNGGTRFEPAETYDEKTEEYKENPDSNGYKLWRAMQDVATEFSWEGSAGFVDGQAIYSDISEKLSDKMLEGDATAYEIVDAIRNSEKAAYITDDKGDMAVGDYIRRVFEEIGFDGIIMDASHEFAAGSPKHKVGGMVMESGVKHYIVFDPTHVKSAIGNKGTFNPNDEDLTKSLLGKDAEFEQKHPRDNDGKFAAGGAGGGLALQGKKATLNGKPLKDCTLAEVKDRIVFIRQPDDNFLMAKGFSLLYFMDSPESAKQMWEGKIPYMMMPKGGIGWQFTQRTDPIVQMWLKRKQQPGQEHILGMVEANSQENQIFVDVASVRKEWRRNGIAGFLVDTMKEQFPNAKLAFSDATDDGKKFIHSLGEKAPDEMEVKKAIVDSAEADHDADAIEEFVQKDAEFEAKHPRGEHGKFAENNTATPPKSEPLQPRLRGLVEKAKMLSRPDVVKIQGQGGIEYRNGKCEGVKVKLSEMESLEKQGLLVRVHDEFSKGRSSSGVTNGLDEHNRQIYTFGHRRTPSERNIIWTTPENVEAYAKAKADYANLVPKPTTKQDEYIYHVTRTESVPRIQSKGLLLLQTTNWVKAKDKARYGQGQVYAFTHPDDALRWAAKMDWDFNQGIGTGKISIIKLKRSDGWEQDPAQEEGGLESAGAKGKWIRRMQRVPSEEIVAVAPITIEHTKKLVGLSPEVKDEDIFKAFTEESHPRSEDGRFAHIGTLTGDTHEVVHERGSMVKDRPAVNRLTVRPIGEKGGDVWYLTDAQGAADEAKKLLGVAEARKKSAADKKESMEQITFKRPLRKTRTVLVKGVSETDNHIFGCACDKNGTIVEKYFVVKKRHVTMRKAMPIRANNLTPMPVPDQLRHFNGTSDDPPAQGTPHAGTDSLGRFPTDPTLKELQTPSRGAYEQGTSHAFKEKYIANTVRGADKRPQDVP